MRPARRGSLIVVLCSALLIASVSTSSGRELVPPQDDGPRQAEINQVVKAAFAAHHRGFSSDEVILDDGLQWAFLESCRAALPDVDDWRFNWTLLNLRKAGKLSDIPTTEFRREPPRDRTAIAEIAARSIQDRHDVTIDRILADPVLRAEFDQAVRQLDASADLYGARKAALQLRKTRRLRPELVTRIATWGRQVETFTAESLAEDCSVVPPKPGIYIFRDATGYLYIGESENVQRRLATHLAGSDRQALTAYFRDAQGVISIEVHTFEEGSPIERLSVRRAYESELIRSRNPRFNVRP